MKMVMHLSQIAGDGGFFLVPEGKEAPEGLDSDIAVIKQPLDNIYLVATSAMDLFCALDGLDSISLSEPMLTDGISTRLRKHWKMEVFLLLVSTVHRITN